METFIYIAKSITILSIFYIIYRVVLQKDTFFTANRHYLLSGIIAALILPFLEYTKTIYKELPSINTMVGTDTIFTPTTIEVLPQQETIAIDWWQVSLLLYTLGAFIMFIRLIIQLISLNRLINNYPKKYKDGYTYVEITDKAITPFSFFKTICYNPGSHSSEELEMILAHEKIHVSQWHTFDVLLTQCVLAIQWFNPFAWFYKKSLEQNLEFIADNGAIQRVSSSLDYQRTLVKVSSIVVQPALTNNFYHSLIKKRIVMLNKQTSNRRNLWKLGLVLPALAIFMYSFNIKEVIEYREVPNEHVNHLSSVSTLDTESKNETITFNTPIENDEVAVAYNNHPVKQQRVFIINNKTSDTELRFIENFFEQHYQDATITINDIKRNKKGILTHYSLRTVFKGKENGGDNIFKYNEQNLKKGTSIYYEKGPAIIIKLLAENVEHISTPNGLTSKHGTPSVSEQDQLEDATITHKEETQTMSKILNDNSKNASDKELEEINKEKPTTATEFKIKISKNTSDQELKKIKKELKKEHQVDFNYSVTRNTKNEIIGINIKYTTSNNNTGNYNTNGDLPISDIFIFQNKDGSTGIGNASSRREINKEMKERRIELRNELEARREELKKYRAELRSIQNNEGKQSEKRRRELEKRMAEREKQLAKSRVEMEVRREEMKEHILERKEEMEARQEEMKERMQERKEEMKAQREEMKEHMQERKEEMEAQREEVKEHLAEMRTQHSDQWNHSNSENIIITKDTTDDQIKSITSELKSQGITFSLTKIKRNNKGEITSYKMKFNNNNGTESVSQKKTNSDSPIESLHIVYGNGNIQVRN